MIPFDANIHLPCSSKLLGERLAEEKDMGRDELIGCFDHYLDEIRKYSISCNFMLFNEEISTSDTEQFTSHVARQIPDARFTLLAQLNPLMTPTRLNKLYHAGVTAIKFHSYVQNITSDKFSEAVSLAEAAADLGMTIFIDTSFGSTSLYDCDNLRLAAEILKQVTSVPVVLLHSGGARALEAMLLAESAENVFLETSFSLVYYTGSRIEQDLAFAYKRIGSHRVIYGSDFPYVGFAESRQVTEAFLQSNDFTKEEKRDIFQESAKKVFAWGVSQS